MGVILYPTGNIHVFYRFGNQYIHPVIHFGIKKAGHFDAWPFAEAI